MKKNEEGIKGLRVQGWLVDALLKDVVEKFQLHWNPYKPRNKGTHDIYNILQQLR